MSLRERLTRILVWLLGPIGRLWQRASDRVAGYDLERRIREAWPPGTRVRFRCAPGAKCREGWRAQWRHEQVWIVVRYHDDPGDYDLTTTATPPDRDRWNDEIGDRCFAGPGDLEVA